MQMNQLLPAGDFAKAFGFKSIIYGPPGSAKTPLINTAPRPVLLACEPGLLSMRGSTIPTWEAYTEKRIDEFFLWFFESNETKNFDTLAIDSTSQMADIYLQEAKKTIKHGLQQYGYMAERTMNHLRRLYFTKDKHTYLVAKEDSSEPMVRKPYWPGKDLNTNIPHLYDAIVRVAKVPVPGVGETLAFRCIGGSDVLARNRTGNLNEYEPPNFSELIKKAMS